MHSEYAALTLTFALVAALAFELVVVVAIAWVSNLAKMEVAWASAWACGPAAWAWASASFPARVEVAADPAADASWEEHFH